MNYKNIFYYNIFLFIYYLLLIIYYLLFIKVNSNIF